MNFKLKCLSCLFLLSAVVVYGQLSDKESQKPTTFEPDIPEHCRNQTICGDVANYPQEHINRIMRRNFMISDAGLGLLVGFDEGKCVKKNHGPNDVDLCNSEMKPLQAKAGQDSNGQWHFLVGEHWLCVELCKNAGETCSREVYVYTGYKATCIQKYITKRTVAVDSKGEMILIDLHIASSCCCHVTQD